MKRREFIQKSALAVGTMGMLPLCRGDLAVDPDLPIIDTHTHFYDPARPKGVPWPSKQEKKLYRTVLPESYQALVLPAPVHATVVVEASSWLEDNQWILDLAKREKFIAGFAGHLDLEHPDFSADLERFRSNLIFRGIRLPGESIRKATADSELLNRLRMLADRDMSLDLLVGTNELPDVAQLAGTIPTLRILIDHMANVHIDGNSPPPAWLDGMKRASEHNNVYAKLSGLVEGTGRADGSAPSDLAFYEPILNAAWDAFGSDRLIYGSNWPVSELFAPCSLVQSIATNYVRTKGRDALNKCFHLNSQAFYKWITRI